MSDPAAAPVSEPEEEPEGGPPMTAGEYITAAAWGRLPAPAPKVPEGSHEDSRGNIWAPTSPVTWRLVNPPLREV